ncbi:MAG: DegV family protein [Oscillibacter sp.]|jgi:DegV family protein with EDD domain|nr:DegV family protein [Oscillibacter sp.]
MNDHHYVIFTDAGADITADLCARYDIRGVPMDYLLNSQTGTFRPEDPQREAVCARFYEALRAGASVSTSQITPFVYESVFSPVLEAGQDILYCCFSSGMSSTWQNLQAVAQELGERYPQRTLRCMDSLSASGGEGLVAFQAALNREAGMSLEENARWLEAHALQVCHWFTVGDLDFLKRGGRVSPALAFLGGKLQIKPILVIADDGSLKVTEKARGQKAAMQNLIRSYKAALNFGDAAKAVFVGHAGAPEAGEQLAELVREASPAGTEVLLIPLSPIIGAHCGPDMLFVCHYGTHR